MSELFLQFHRMLAVAVGVPLLILLLGIVPIFVKRRRTAVAAEFAGHAIGWGILAIGILIWAPKFQMIFEDFEIEVAARTQMLFQICEFVRRPGGIFLPIGLTMIPLLDASIFYYLWSNQPGRRLHKYWSLAMTAVLLWTLITSAALLLFPCADLMNNLS